MAGKKRCGGKGKKKKQMAAFVALVIFSVHIGRISAVYPTGYFSWCILLIIHFVHTWQALVHDKSWEILDTEKIGVAWCTSV
jgi:hypothetical protein